MIPQTMAEHLAIKKSNCLTLISGLGIIIFFLLSVIDPARFLSPNVQPLFAGSSLITIYKKRAGSITDNRKNMIMPNPEIKVKQLDNRRPSLLIRILAFRNTADLFLYPNVWSICFNDRVISECENSYQKRRTAIV